MHQIVIRTTLEHETLESNQHGEIIVNLIKDLLNEGFKVFLDDRSQNKVTYIAKSDGSIIDLAKSNIWAFSPEYHKLPVNVLDKLEIYDAHGWFTYNHYKK